MMHPHMLEQLSTCTQDYHEIGIIKQSAFEVYIGANECLGH